MKEILRDIGQLFMIGFPGERPPAPFLNFLSEERIGGVILFADNCCTNQMTRENIERIVLHCSDSPLVAVDQEGGPVCRLRGAPAMLRAAASYGDDGSVERFKEDYTRVALLLKSVGINLNLAPVADIFLNDENSCLEGRCYGREAEKVADFVRASVTVANEHGLLSCLKHFPGLGAAEIDPHVAVSTADYDELIWRQREKIPFVAGVDAGADMVMTTHLQVPAVDSKVATASHRMIYEWIRGELGFDGPVITDELGMKGADVLGNIGERAVAAFKAGHDILLFGQDYEAGMRAYDYFVDTVRRGELSVDQVRVSLDRVAGVKFKLGRSPVC